MLKGTCQWPECKAEFTWEPPLIIESDLYTVVCPNCNASHVVEEGKILTLVFGRVAQKEMLYQLFFVRNGVHQICYDGATLSLENAKSEIEKYSRPNLRYYMKPVLDGLA